MSGCILLNWSNLFSQNNPSVSIKNNNTEIIDSTSQIKFDSIQLGCVQFRKGNYIVNDQLEYNELFSDLIPHPLCINYEPPAIDFNKKTLIGFIQGVGGCGRPIIHTEIQKDAIFHEYIITFDITQYGDCKMYNPIHLWFQIPKIEPGYSIEFVIDKKVK